MPRTSAVLSIITFLMLSLAATESIAQGGFLEKMMRDLLESQRQRQQEAQRPPVVTQGAGRPRQAGSPTALVRGNLQAFAQGTDELSGLLRKEVRRNRSVAPYLVQMVRVKSRAEMLGRKYSKPQSDTVILADLQELDREWRDTAHRLGQVPGLSPPCRQSIGRLNDLCAACCSPFDLAPQFDRREVARLADSLAAELHHLERDIEYEIRQPRKAQRLLLGVQRAEGLAKLVGEAAHQCDPFDVVVDAYRGFRQEWRPLAATLRGVDDRHITRTLTEVRELGVALRGHLRMEAQIDRDRLVALAASARKQVLAACSAISLSTLISQPNAPVLLAAAQTVDREANALCECVAAASSDADLAEHWRSLNNSWQAFDALAGPLLPTKSVGLRRDVGGCLHELRDVIGIQNAFDRREITRCAAQLASVAGEAQRRVAMWQGRPGARIDAALIRGAKVLIDDCQSLHKRCAGSATPTELATDCRRLSQNWAVLRPQLMACNTVDQRVLRRLADDATGTMIRLQSLLDAATI